MSPCVRSQGIILASDAVTRVTIEGHTFNHALWSNKRPPTSTSPYTPGVNEVFKIFPYHFSAWPIRLGDPHREDPENRRAGRGYTEHTPWSWSTARRPPRQNLRPLESPPSICRWEELADTLQQLGNL